jgi:membrane-associated protease RseP (regulator of RpoE activity)
VAEIRISIVWAGLAAASLAAMAWLALGGLYLLAFLGVVILTHEAGHLVVARWMGMRPVEYFWGFGPDVFSFRRGGCRYGIKALFLGGYVKLLGMTPSSDLPDGFPEAGTYRAASHRGRLATILAGPAVNLACAGLAFAAASLVEGQSLGSAVAGGASDVWFVIAGTARALWQWGANIGAYLASLVDASGATPAPVRFMSPVTQAQVSGWAVDSGLAPSLRWFGVLSAAVGAVNLLPLPPLDGSHALIAAAEGAWQRLQPAQPRQLDVARLLPLAYLTVALLGFLSVSALVMDLRDVL